MDSPPEQPFADQAVEPPLRALSPAEFPPIGSQTGEPSTARHVFLGRFGLRAGWSLLIYFAILAAILFSVHGVQMHIRATRAHAAAAAAIKAGKPVPAAPKAATPDPKAPLPLANIVVAEAIGLAVVLFVSWLMALIEHRKLSVFGLGGRHSLSRFLTGAGWGLLAMALLIATLCAMHLLVFDARLLHGSAVFGWAAAQLFAFLLVGCLEEYVFRGYLQFTLTRGMVGLGELLSAAHARAGAFWIAAVITSALFFFAHTRNGGENKLGLFIVFLAGLLFLVALWRTGSLWWAIGFHMAWDWSQSFLYGVPDSGGLMQGRLFATHALGRPLLSGGTDGPEGSLLCVPILFLVILVLLFTHPSPQPPLETKGQPVPPDLSSAGSTRLPDAPVGTA
jgi:membrane protease YdiL (CAAX protease family)